MRTARMALIPALALGLASLMACERKDDGGGYGAGSRDRTRTDTGRSATSDSSWLVKAAEANLAEIETGRLAAAKSASTDVKRGLECGAADYFIKPVELPSLIARLRQLAADPGATAGSQPS